MERCKDCGYWDRSPGAECGFGVGISVRVCTAVPLKFDACEWVDDGHGNIRNVLKKEYERTTAFADDPSDYSAKLYTTADHGCTMFKRREDGEIETGASE